MNKLILMIGVPGSGKSTAAQKLSKEYGAKIFSSDDYRKNLLGSENDQSKNEYIFKCLYKDAKEYLQNVGNIIIDATNINHKDRNRVFLNFEKLEYERVACIVNTPISVCITQDKQRNRTVGEGVVWRFIKKFEFPTPDEKFTKIILTNQGNYPIVSNSFEDWVPKTINFDQNNHHHSMTLDKHIESVMSNYSPDQLDYYAAKYHDIGKLYTKEEDDTGESHYYCHENVSTYWLLSHIEVLPKFILNDVDSLYQLMILINYHMRAMTIFSNPTTVEKYNQRVGAVLMEKLKLFNFNDTHSK